jgi:hypothetical protein
MDLFLIDATSPFFRNRAGRRTNWSKIPFTKLESGDWPLIEEEMRVFADRVSRLGYNAVSLDDLAHLAPHPLHEPEVAGRIGFLRGKFSRLFQILHAEFDLRIFLTSDVLPLTPALAMELAGQDAALESYYHGLVRSVLDDFPELAGIILRIGESDGHDVKDPIRTRLHLKNARQANRMLRDLLPEFEARGRELIFRTWTVGAHRIGDLMWNRNTLAKTLDGLDSPNLIVSMKHGESDFFRYLPLNRSFFQIKQRKLIELQARREYEGAGEFPSFIGRDCERFAADLSTAENMAGISVWCQTGGWHRFGRRAFLENDGSDLWIRLNAAAAVAVFKNGGTAETSVSEVLGNTRAQPAIELLDHAESVIRDLFYVAEFASQMLFFRRVRIPPLVHVYWDSLFINRAVRTLLRHFVRNPGAAIRQGEQAADRLEEMIQLAKAAELPVDDIEHMRDFCGLLCLARRYYFTPDDDALIGEIRAAKQAYKARWPRDRRYRIRLSFTPLPTGRRATAIAAGLLLRRKRGYRWLDRLFVLHAPGLLLRLIQRRKPKALPKFLRKSAMGVEALLK